MDLSIGIDLITVTVGVGNPLWWHHSLGLYPGLHKRGEHECELAQNRIGWQRAVVLLVSCVSVSASFQEGKTLVTLNLSNVQSWDSFGLEPWSRRKSVLASDSICQQPETIRSFFYL